MRAEHLHEQYKEDIIQERSNNSKNKKEKCWGAGKQQEGQEENYITLQWMYVVEYGSRVRGKEF